jgi:uncharacterized membrane protein YphA (DoxX/SURF4 family)
MTCYCCPVPPPPTVLGQSPALPPPLRDWKWLTVPVAAERAAALRIAVGVVLLLDILIFYLPAWRSLYGPGGFGDPAVYDDVFASTWRWSLLRLLPPAWGPQFLLGIWVVAAFNLLVGYRPRLAAFVCWLLAVSFQHSNPHAHNGGDQLKLFLLLMLSFLPSDGRWAIRPHPLARTMAGPVLVQPWPLRLLMIQLAIVYFMNGYYKAMGPQWRDGSIMTDVSNNPTWTHFSPNYLPLPDPAFPALAWGTIIWELLFPVLVLMPLTRKVTLWIGVIFHVGTLVHLEVGWFPLYSLCFYVPLLRWERRAL